MKAYLPTPPASVGEHRKTGSKLSAENLHQAAQWYATLRDENATDADRMARQGWLSQAPENEAAWAHLEAVSSKFDPVRGAGPRGAAAAAVRAARHAVVKRRQVFNTLAGVLASGALWLGWRHSPGPEWVMAVRASHHTGTGERRDLVLADGTHVWLNTRTALNADYDASQRRLTLLQGEILVQTGSDSLQRPLYVDVNHGRLQPLGTRFSVRLMGAATRLDVFEGAVEIRTSKGKVQHVPAGQAAVFDAESISAPMPADRVREAWSRGSLPADNLPLGELLEELSRYRHGYISVAPKVADLKVMGVYPADDPDRTLSMLEQSLPIRVRHTLPWWVVVDAR